MPRESVTLDLRPLSKFVAALTSVPASATHPIRRAMRQWAKRYSGFAMRRFTKYSRGGGDWKPLAPSTVARRRKGRGKSVVKAKKTGGKAAILVDTGIMRQALNIGARGNLLKDLPNGVRFGFGGPAKHDDKSPATIADIARYHDQGGRGGRPPRRRIIDEPDTATCRAMAGDLKRGISLLGKSVSR